MKKVIILLALIALLSTIYSCGGGAGSSSSPSGQNPGIPSVVKLLPSQYIAQTNSYIYLKAKVLDGNGIPVPNTPVTFTNLSPIGVLSATSANTDVSGIATITLKSTTTGFATVQAEVNTGAGQVRDRKILYFSDFALMWPQPTITLSIDADNDGIYNETSDFNFFETPTDDTAIIKAIARDESGNKIVGMKVTFSGDTGASFPLGDTFTTNSKGEAFAQVKINPTSIVGFETALNIQARGENGAVGFITVFLEPVTITGITLVAGPTVIGLGETSAIAASVTTSAGIIPDDVPVQFSVSPVTIGSVSPVIALTENGVATTTFTASTTATGTATITGSVGGQSGITTVTVLVSKELTVIPTTQTISNPAVGNTALYTVSGGTAPYQAFSDNPALVTVPSGTFTGPTLTATVAGVPTTDTTVTITIYDSVGANVTASLVLDVPPTVSLAVIPTTQTISNPVVGNSRTYTIIGGTGTGTYRAYSSRPDLVTVPSGLLPGSTVTATVAAGVSSLTDDTTVTITIYDSVGANASASLVLDVVPTAALTVTPASITVTGTSGTTDNVTFYISGGTGTYSATAFSSNTAVIPPAAVVGNNFTINPNVVSASTTVTMTITDSAGTPKSATVTVTPATSAMAINPSSIAVTNGTTITFNIIGGVSPYDVYSSNMGIVALATNPLPDIAGPTFTATAGATDGSATITVVDSDGQTVTATVTVN